jgi:hypothetical protein
VRILFDQGTPLPLRDALAAHEVRTAYELGWSTMRNGELLAKAERQFELLVTTDRNLRFQQNLQGRRLAVLVLPTTSWPVLRGRVAEIVAVLNALRPGEFRQL